MPTITVDAVLFDMDGTLIDSTPGVLAAWDQFGSKYGFDGIIAANEGHGRRLADTLGKWCRLKTAEELSVRPAAIVRFEEAVIEGGPIPLPGAINLLTEIDAGSSPSAHFGWTIVTSGMSVYTPKALASTGVPLPTAGYVTSDDVKHGKPLPDPYLAGAARVGVDPKNCLVVEDAPSGLFAGRAAGARTLAVCTSHSRDAIIASGAAPDYIVNDLTRVSARWVDGKVVVGIDDSL
ncbi:HAD-like protein [Multifurca ochricompacta]|uniref:HAD-like protein n=1 Tax=Multifurca ochricompacta TaxID=376703 RepID=A0AAD4QTD3_9AGAM|nr:HAD-like protein [Multifurca ochricompacta]